ncbi:MAG: AsmA-like C-terminal region-containing protein [Gemmatimonadota bacterium]
MALKVSSVLWASSEDGDVPLTSGLAAAHARPVEVELEGGYLIAAGLLLAPDQRLTDYLQTAPSFVPLREAEFRIDLDGETIRLTSLAGTLADGALKASGWLTPEGQWPMHVEAAIDRLDVRDLAAVAGRPENELVGRLSLQDFTLEGPAFDRDKWTGSGHARFGEGHLWRLPVFDALKNQLLSGIASFLRDEFDPTSFRTAEADIQIADGRVHLPGATIDSDIIRMVIEGDVMFDRALDLHVAASVRGDQGVLRGLQGLADLLPGGLGKDLGEGVGKAREVLGTLPGGLPIVGGTYHVTGTFDEPVVRRELGRSIKSVGEKALGFLKRTGGDPVDESAPPVPDDGGDGQ